MIGWKLQQFSLGELHWWEACSHPGDIKLWISFYNYKGVLMALVDYRYCFTIIDFGGHGSSSDGGIFALGKAIRNETLALPQLTTPHS